MKKHYLAAFAAACATALQVTAQVETRAFYATNPADAVGKKTTITIDGKFNDWSDDMIIATAGANDICTAFHGSHENCVIDMYTLYGAWDDSNIYLAWQMVNTGDTWARPGDGPLTDGGRIGDVPLIVSLSVNPSAQAMNGRLTNGNAIWCDNPANGVEFQSHVDHLLFMSAKVGQGAPAMFKAVNTKGETDYQSGCQLFSNIGVKYACSYGFAPSHLWRNRTYADWADAETLISDPSILENIYLAESYDNLMDGPVDGLKPHDTEYDTFYEIAIPLRALGINAEWLETYGIGVRVVGTRGESGIDCIPFDPSMVDNVFEKYFKDSSTSHEKDDIDVITYDLASLAKMRDSSIVPPTPEQPDPIEPDPIDPTDPDGNYTVYYVDQNTNPWNNVKVWIWDAGNANKNYTGGTWPGKDMTTCEAIPGFDGKKYWIFSLSTEDTLTKPMIIFNNGSGQQTADLEMKNNGVYTNTGIIGSYSSINTIDEDFSCENQQYFNLQGIRISNPKQGEIYLVRRGLTTTKEIKN